MRNIFGDQGNKERNFWEQGNSIKVNFGEHLNLFLRNKGTTVNFHREQGNMTPPPPWEALQSKLTKSTYNLRNSFSKRTIDQKCTGEVCIFKNTVAKIKNGLPWKRCFKLLYRKMFRVSQSFSNGSAPVPLT